MTEDEARRANVGFLLSSADEALASARSEAAAHRHRFAMNRVYYACFYAASAVLVAEGRHFVKHAGVRSAVHQHLVKPGRLTVDWGAFFDEAFLARQEADYGQVVEIDAVTVGTSIERAIGFVGEMKRLLDSKAP